MQKRERNSEKSKKDILDSAEIQFSLKGFYGARIDTVADLANINKRMIYEYYVNKETLYKEVLFSVYKRMEIAERHILTNKLSGVELVREIISTYFNFLEKNPTFVNILMWENLNCAAYLNELPAENLERTTLKYFIDEINNGKKMGLFKENIDAEQTVMSLITVSFANFSNKHTLSKIFHKDLTSSEMLKIRMEHTIDLMLCYICK